MTTFEPHGNHFRLETLVPVESARALLAIRDVEQRSVTEGLRHIISVRKFYDQCQETGSLLVARTSRLESIAPTPEVVYEGERAVPMRVSVNEHVKNYLEPLSNPADPRDLLGFWRSTVNFYSDMRERQLFGAEFFRLTANLSMRQVYFNDPFSSQENPEKRRRLGLPFWATKKDSRRSL